MTTRSRPNPPLSGAFHRLDDAANPLMYTLSGSDPSLLVTIARLLSLVVQRRACALRFTLGSVASVFAETTRTSLSVDFSRTAGRSLDMKEFALTGGGERASAQALHCLGYAHPC